MKKRWTALVLALALLAQSGETAYRLGVITEGVDAVVVK